MNAEIPAVVERQVASYLSAFSSGKYSNGEKRSELSVLNLLHKGTRVLPAEQSKIMTLQLTQMRKLAFEPLRGQLAKMRSHVAEEIKPSKNEQEDEINSKLTALTKLRVDSGSGLSGEGLRNLLVQSPNLTELELNINLKNVQDFLDPIFDFEKMPQNSAELQKLSLSNCSFNPESRAFTKILEANPSLTELTVRNVSGINPDEYGLIGELCPNLKHLSIELKRPRNEDPDEPPPNRRQCFLEIANGFRRSGACSLEVLTIDRIEHQDDYNGVIDLLSLNPELQTIRSMRNGKPTEMTKDQFLEKHPHYTNYARNRKIVLWEKNDNLFVG